MRYMVAKVSEKEYAIFSVFSGPSSELNFETSEFYDSVEDATVAIKKHQAKLDEKTDKTWNEASDAQRKDWAEKLKEPNMVLHSERYVIIPIQSVVEINSVPKYMRGTK